MRDGTLSITLLETGLRLWIQLDKMVTLQAHL